MAGAWTGRLNVLRLAAARISALNVLRLTGAAALVGIGLGALVVAEGPGKFTTYAGSSTPAAALALLAGFSLAGAALVISFTRPAGRVADLVLLAGVAWFAPVWVGWQDGPALVRSLGMVVTGLWFALLVHALLAYPGGRLGSRSARALVAAIYAEWAIAAALLALFRDPYFDPSCWSNCTVNDFLVHSAPSLVQTVETIDEWFAVVAAAGVAIILSWRLWRASGPTRLTILSITVPGVLLAGAIAAHSIALARVTVEDPTKSIFASIFIATSASVILVAAGLALVAIRARSRRLAIARTVGDLGEAPPPGSLQSALSRALGDPALRIAYWLPSSQRYVDAVGRALDEPAPAPGRVVTTLAYGDRTIAVVSHAGTHPDLEREMGPALRLGLENERLQAEVMAQLEEIRASRARIVETGDGERRRLERDLHDGAQQRLLALSYDLKLARTAADGDGDREAEEMLAAAAGEARTALAELRELAHGIFPAILAEAGLGPALESLADSAPVPVEIREMAEGRAQAAVEMAAYVVVVDAVDDAVSRGATRVAVDAVDTDSRLMLTVTDDGSARTSSMLAAADRVGAVGGTLEVEQNMLRASMPSA